MAGNYHDTRVNPHTGLFEVMAHDEEGVGQLSADQVFSDTKQSLLTSLVEEEDLSSQLDLVVKLVVLSAGQVLRADEVPARDVASIAASVAVLKGAFSTQEKGVPGGGIESTSLLARFKEGRSN